MHALPEALRGIATCSADDLRRIIMQNTPHVAMIGAWPPWVDRHAALAGRLPTEEGAASGFDAGIACALGLMPPHAQKLAAVLHAAYTAEAVADIRAAVFKDAQGVWRVKDADTPVAWWLAACHLCREGDEVDLGTFRRQVEDFSALHHHPAARKAAAEETLNDMCRSFDTVRGYAYGEKDGCLQGAYIAGHDVAVMHARHHGVYFIGTFHASLGLESFIWGAALDDKGRAKSGPVHGSRQFVKCADEDELARALRAVSVSAAVS